MKSPAERPSGSSPRTLPEGWRWVKLGDACRQDRQIVEPSTDEADSLTYYSLEHIESETGRILKAPIEQVEDEGKSTTFRFDKRHVLYGKLRPYLNKVALPDAAGRCTTEMIPLLPGDGIDRVFLAWILRRGETVEFAMHGKTGSRMPRADMSNLLTLELSLPPLPEQQRIADILREQMATVEKARAAAQARLEAVKALPVAFLRQVFPQPGRRLPDGWRWAKLGEVCKIEMGQSPPGDSYNGNKNGEPLLNGPSEFGEKYPVAVQWTTAPTKFAGDGDILFCVRGATTGRKNLADKRYCIGRGLAALRAKEGSSSNAFIWYLLDVVTERLLERAAGSTFINLPGAELEKFAIPFPPLSEQQRIAAILNEQMAAVEKARAAAEAELNTINALPAALLRRAFNGEI